MSIVLQLLMLVALMIGLLKIRRLEAAMLPANPKLVVTTRTATLVEASLGERMIEIVADLALHPVSFPSAGSSRLVTAHRAA
jgi:hypothetical protein